MRSLARTWVLRDDLLPYGSKTRKLRPIIAHWQVHGYQAAVLVGGALSNNVLAAARLCVQQGLRPIALLRGEVPYIPQGNFAALQLVVPTQDIHWLPRNQWAQRDTVAAHLAAQYAPLRVAVCPEGAVVPAAVAGLQQLVHEIRAYEQQSGIRFAQVWLDAGTGFTAAVCCWASHLLGEVRHYHIVQMAGDSVSFATMLATVQPWVDHTLLRSLPSNYILHSAALAPRYGYINTAIQHAQQHYLAQEGLLLDPIYGVKLFATYAKHCQLRPSPGPVLLLHSGAPLS